MTASGPSGGPAPVWDRGDPIDPEMLRFTVGDDWRMDRRLVAVDIEGSLAHVGGLAAAGILTQDEHERLRRGLADLLTAHRRGEWTVEPTDEDVHSAVENRLFRAIGEVAKKLHTGRSRNEQVALDVRLWLRSAIAEVDGLLADLAAACARLRARSGALPLPGYTHLQRAMPSTVGDWVHAHEQALRVDAEELGHARLRLRACPLGSGAGYGAPLELPRAAVAAALGFATPEIPATFVQHSRGRAELAYVTALEGIALDLAKLAEDLWLFSTSEFGFAKLPVALTTGSSLMPQKRNPDLLELTRAHARQVLADRDAVRAVLAGLPSGYHRDFQLLKPPLFRAHDRIAAMLPLLAKALEQLTFDEAALARAAADPALQAVARLMERVQKGEAFRDAYRDESKKAGG